MEAQIAQALLLCGSRIDAELYEIVVKVLGYLDNFINIHKYVCTLVLSNNSCLSIFRPLSKWLNYQLRAILRLVIMGPVWCELTETNVFKLER